MTHDTLRGLSNVTVTPVECGCCGDYGWVTCEEDCYADCSESVSLLPAVHTHPCRHCPAGADLEGTGCECETPGWPCPICGVVPAVTP